MSTDHPAGTGRVAHWETVYRTKAADAVSWYRPHLEQSLAWIRRVADETSAVIDVGAGASTLADDLLAAGFRDLSVLDLSAAALAVAQQRLGSASTAVHWLAADVLTHPFAQARYDLWHDRAVFHFLTEAGQQAQYVGQLRRALKTGGHAIFAIFGPKGPTQCSGLPTARYSAQALTDTLGADFTLLDHDLIMHGTPFGTQQQFLYSLFRRN